MRPIDADALHNKFCPMRSAKMNLEAQNDN